MLENGYIRLHRSLLGWEWYGDNNTKILFIHLLLTVNYEDNQWRGITIKRGQRVYSRATLAAECKLSEREVRTALNHLISTNETTNLTTPQYSIITVSNYDKYQQATSETTSDRPANDQPTTSDRPQCNKANKANKANKENIPPIPPNGESLFDEFWKAYPKKQAKGTAEKAFAKLKPNRELLGVMLSAIELQHQSSDWQKDGGQFIPHPATWLNQKRWEDEGTTKPKEDIPWR